MCNKLYYFSQLGSLAGSASSNAYTYVGLSSQSDASGTVGLAWVQSTCYYNKHYRTSMNDYFYDDSNVPSQQNEGPEFVENPRNIPNYF